MNNKGRETLSAIVEGIDQHSGGVVTYIEYKYDKDMYYVWVVKSRDFSSVTAPLKITSEELEHSDIESIVEECVVLAKSI